MRKGFRAAFLALAGLVWVEAGKRESATRLQVKWAVRLRWAGLCTVLVVPLAVSSAAVAPIVWAAAKEGKVPNMVGLGFALALSALYAWYAGFVTHLLLFAPPLESIRWQDSVLPGLLGIGYLVYAGTTYYHLPLGHSLGSKGFLGTAKDVVAGRPYLYLFLCVYVLWLLRDILELRHQSLPNGQHEKTKQIIRRIWLCVDVFQIAVMVAAILHWNFIPEVRSYLHLQLKDVAVLGAFVGWIFVTSTMTGMRAANEAQAFSNYVDAIESQGPDSPLPPDAKSGNPYVLLDVGCGDGRRTREILGLLGGTPLHVIGVDRSPSLESKFESTVKRSHCCVRFDYSERLTVDLVAKLAIPAAPAGVLVVHVSHFALSTRREVAEMRAFLEALGDRIDFLIWRAPALGSLSHTAATLSGGDLFVPPFLPLLHGVFVKEVADRIGLSPVECDPVNGKPTRLFRQAFQPRQYGAFTEWISCSVPTRIADRVQHWLSQQRNSRSSIADHDSLFVFSRPSSPRP